MNKVISHVQLQCCGLLGPNSVTQKIYNSRRHVVRNVRVRLRSLRQPVFVNLGTDSIVFENMFLQSFRCLWLSFITYVAFAVVRILSLGGQEATLGYISRRQTIFCGYEYKNYDFYD